MGVIRQRVFLLSLVIAYHGSIQSFLLLVPPRNGFSLTCSDGTEVAGTKLWSRLYGQTGRTTIIAADNSDPDPDKTPHKAIHQPISRRKFVTWSSMTGIFTGYTWTGDPSPVLAKQPVERDADIIGDDDATVQEISVIPFSSNRRYKTIRLSNGMQVVLVSDKVVRQASAALTIGGAGQFSDPPGLNGMAHLMEHMTLSSRTSRRQLARNKVQDFEEWLADVDGTSNGFTGTSHPGCSMITKSQSWNGNAPRHRPNATRLALTLVFNTVSL